MKKKMKSLLVLLVVICLTVSGVGLSSRKSASAAGDYQEVEIPYNKDIDSGHSFEYENESGESEFFKIQLEQNDYLEFKDIKAVYDSNMKKLKDLKCLDGYAFDEGTYYLEVAPNKHAYVDRDNFKRIIKGDIVKKDKYFLYYYNIPYNSHIKHTISLFGASVDEPETTSDGNWKIPYGAKGFRAGFVFNHITAGKHGFDVTLYCKNKNSEVDYNYRLNDQDISAFLKGEKPKMFGNSSNTSTSSKEETKKSASKSKKKDTKKPTVKGVKNGKTYKKNVKFKVSDKSGIKKVTLNKKKIKVSKAKKGYTVKKKGKYTLSVWDKAGNKRVVKFKIKK